MLNTITKIKERHPGHWFEKGSMAFFNTKFPPRSVYAVPGGAFFITSEYSKGVYISTGWIPDGPVGYSVRFISDHTGAIDTVSIFQQYETLEDARAAAKQFRDTYLKEMES